MKLKIEECINKHELIDGDYYYIKSGNFNIAYWSKEKECFLAETKKGVQSLEYKEAKPFHNTKKQYDGDYKLESKSMFNMTEYKLLLKGISEKRPVYTGCFLSDKGKTLLLSEFQELIPDSWAIKCHHMTLNLGSCKDKYKEHLGNVGELIVTDFSICNDLGVAALKVQSLLPSDNETKHITLAVSKSGNAMNSNKLENWNKINNNIVVTGIVGEYLLNGDISYPKTTKKNTLRLNK